MALETLAYAADLPSSVDTSDSRQVSRSLAAASEAVRDAAGVPINQATSTVKLLGTRERWLALPGVPVVSVSSVLIDGSAVTDYALREGRLYRSWGWQGYGPVFATHRYDPDFPSEVTVTMVHGLIEVPADIVALVAALAAADINAAADGYASKAGIASEGIDDYRVTYTSGEEAQTSPVEIPERTRESLRLRFSGGAYVTGSR